MYIEDISKKNGKELETLMQIIRIYSQHIGMESGIEKCDMLIIKIRKREETERIIQPYQESIRTPEED